MGQRANLIIATKNSYEIYYNHWCANTLTEDLFWGEQHAVNFIRKQKKVDKENGWLDEVWAEGGAVVDIERRVFLIYGGEDLKYDVPLRRIYLKLLSQVWTGWDVRWANEGIADLADYVGYPRENVLKEYKEPEYNASFSPPEERDWIDIVGSIKIPNNDIMIFPLAGNVEDYLLNGYRALNKINNSFAYEKLKFAEWTPNFPSGGFHINMIDKSIDFWIARDCPGLLDRLKLEWEGWKLNWNYDKFEIQIESSNNKIDLRVPSTESLLSQIKGMLLRDCKDPVESFLDVTDILIQNGRNVKVNPWAFEDQRLDLNRYSREEILDEVIKCLKT